MIDILIKTLKILIAVLPFVLLCFRSIKVNLPKTERSRQYAMPIIALLYVILCMIFIDKINDGIMFVINGVPRCIAALANLSWMPNFLYTALNWLSTVLTNLINALNLKYWIFYIANIVIILLYLWVKRICMAIISAVVKSDGTVHNFIASWFYRFFFERGLWCLKESYSQVRDFFKTFYFAAMVLSTGLLVLSAEMFLHESLKTVFYPVYGILIVGELFFYLDGYTQGEYGSVIGEDDEAYRVVNYSLLRKYLRSLFKDKLLAENTGLNSALAYNVTTEDVLNELEKSEDPKIHPFAAYVKALHKTGFPIDHNYLRSSLDLLNGKSILFNNPFYKDLIPYAFYPMNRALLAHKKVLVVLGRHSIEDDIKQWIEDGINAVTNIPFMWNIGELKERYEDDEKIEIGIITRSSILDVNIHEANEEFFKEVGYVVILEPSKLITTAQIGLNLLVKKCTVPDKDIVYCMCDKNCDGLVDAMSHILMTNITEVSATNKYKGSSSYMCWEAHKDFLHHRLVPNISRYLGFGTELSFAALKNQIAKVEWYGGEAFPVTDMRWIDRQYYYDLTKYAGLPASQETMDEYFKTSANFWSAGVEQNNYFTVEDEAYNMFEILRDFSTRTTNQGFINVISQEYLLKDYMAANAPIFESDAKAIPYIVADYARTSRNTILRLLLMMSKKPVNSDVVVKELSLLGLPIFDLKQQFWFELYKCFASVGEIDDVLREKYEDSVAAAAERSMEYKGLIINQSVIENKQVYDVDLGKTQETYFINDYKFIEKCISDLRSASYMAEDEKGEKHYLGAELKGHIYQRYLPGQFFTFGGKYYEMQYLTDENDVLVRRAADHINGRPSYRQIRKYTFEGIRQSEEIGAVRDVSGMKVVREYADFTVSTDGYFKMDVHNDFSSAKRVVFEGSKIPDRVYKNKTILRVDLPSADGQLNDQIRYTVTVLFNEIFRTIFAENQAYICALTSNEFVEETDTDPMTYDINSKDCDLNPNSIYIVEDSQLDLGLVVAVERNLQRIFEIMFDYLKWHSNKLGESLITPPSPPSNVTFAPADDTPKKGVFGRVIDRIKKLLGIKPKDGDKPTGETPTDETPTDETPTDETPIGETPTGETPTDEIPSDKDPKKKGLWGKIKGIFGGKKKPEDPTDTDPVDVPDISDIPEIPETPEIPEIPETPEVPENPVSADVPEIPTDDAPTDKTPTDETPVDESPKKKGLWGKIKGLFGGKKQPKEPKDSDVVDVPEIPEIPETPDVPEIPTDDAPTVETPTDETPENPASSDAQETPELPESPTDSNDPMSENALPLRARVLRHGLEENCPGDTGSNEPKLDRAAGVVPDRKKYYERYYLLFGGSYEPKCINSSTTKDFLEKMGFGDNNSLTKAREGRSISVAIASSYNPDKKNVRYCDFCGTEIYGIEYETLSDGRDRCLQCSRTAIKSGKEFVKIFEEVRRNMESFFGIKLNVGVKVEMVNARTLHKRLGESFTPTPGQDGRVLGVAIRYRDGSFSLLVENGSPRMASIMTMAHELTHIWQYTNWNAKQIRRKYGKQLELEVYEGMAKWVEVQYAYLINEPALAKRTEIITAYRPDEYGRGFLRYRAQYPFSLGTYITRDTPFMFPEEPLAKEYCGEITVIPPRDDSVGIPYDDDDYTDGGDGTDGGIPTGDGSGYTPGSSTAVDDALKGPILRDIENPPLYAKSTLSDEDKVVYDMFLDAVMNFTPVLNDIPKEMTAQQVHFMFEQVMIDHPEIFWFRGNETSYTPQDSDIVCKIELTFRYTQEEVEVAREKIASTIQPFIESINDDMSDFEVVLKAYETLVDLVDYDTIALDKQQKIPYEQRMDKPDPIRTIYGVFVDRKAVCAGYARAMQFLLKSMGIEAAFVSSGLHAWNLVKLEGDYYHLDVTWADGSNTSPEKNAGDMIDYSFFCVTSKEMLSLDAHQPTDILKLPECTATKCNYHHRFGLYLESYDENRVRSKVCDFVKQGQRNLSFKFSNMQLRDQALSELFYSKKLSEMLRFAAMETGVKISLDYTCIAPPDRPILNFYLTDI